MPNESRGGFHIEHTGHLFHGGHPGLPNRLLRIPKQSDQGHPAAGSFMRDNMPVASIASAVSPVVKDLDQRMNRSRTARQDRPPWPACAATLPRGSTPETSVSIVSLAIFKRTRQLMNL